MRIQFRTTLARLDRAVEKFALPFLTRFSVPASKVQSVAENSAARSTKKLPALTSLRFVAAMLIVVHHSRGRFGLPQNLWQPFVLDQGVSFFFVLSGFILTYIYPSLSIIGKRRFLLARVARIWPAHVTAFILLIVLAPSSLWNTVNTNSLGTMLANLLLAHAWIPLKDYYFSFNSPSWSISTELGFYLCFLLLIHNWQRTWHLKLVLTFLITYSMIVVANVFHLPDDTLVKSGSTSLGFVYIHPLARLFEFTVGMTTALAWRYAVSRVKGRALIGTILELAALGLAVFTMYYSIFWTRNLQIYPLIDSAGALWLVHGGLTWLSFAALILVMALEWGLISRLFSFWLFVLLGEISFSVYLIHQILLRYYAAHSIAFATIPGWFVYTVFWIVTLLTAHLTWSAVERPCRAFLVGLWPKRSNILTIADRAQSPSIEALRSEAKCNPLLAPTRLWSLTEALVLLILLLPITYLANNRINLSQVSPAYAAEVASRNPQGIRPVHFGDRFVLLAVDMRPTTHGLEVELIWQSTTRQRLEFQTAVHLLDGSGKILSQFDYLQDSAEHEILEGIRWRDVIVIPNESLPDARTLAIGLLHSPSTWLLADHGLRDAGNRRLLLQLPSAAPTASAFSMSTPASTAGETVQYSGYLDHVDCVTISGWAWNKAQVNTAVQVEIYSDNKLLMTVPADKPRSDLIAAHMGTGQYGFTYAIPDQMRDGQAHAVRVKIEGANFEVPFFGTTPQSFTCPAK